ncbi:MAG: transglycosylase SLT domain-containing protein [Myxococcales bacterium]|nr:transglycosylase SLT domain-containing protein [Myxococcales bacterium]
MRQRILCLLMGLLATSWGVGEVRAEGRDRAKLLARAMRGALVLNHKRYAEEPVFVRHCRDARAGCTARLEAFSHYFEEAGNRHHVDPWLLAAMAFRESSLNPFATGALGERGLLQMHPKSPWGRQVRFVKDSQFRARCTRQTGACQKELIERATDLLARSLRLCDGDVSAALGSYNTGRCGGNPDYAKKVLETRNALRGSVGLGPVAPKEVPFQPLQASFGQPSPLVY